jgi:ABC-type phosphate/phosphonate transport system substrate-binding protein
MTIGALFAALPMYDTPETARANEALWAAIARRLRDAGIEAPETLTRAADFEAQWQDPNLALGQTCGYPFVKGLQTAVALIATPHYDFPGCDGAGHCSFLVARREEGYRTLAELRGKRAAINSWTSNSGTNLFRATIAPIAGGAPFFGAVVATGSHMASLRAVAEGAADVASIDCVTFALVGRAHPELIERIAILAESPLSPGLPFIASARLSRSVVDTVREVLIDVLDDPGLAQTRSTLGLSGATVTTPADYGRVLDLERQAERLGYPQLA